MITPKQIRAARAILGWSQQDLAGAVELSKPTIVDAEKDGHQARVETLERIARAFEQKGLEFITGGVKERDDILTVFEGENCAFKLIDKIENDYSNNQKNSEILYYGADHERSTDELIERFKKIKSEGVSSRYLIKNNDTCIMEDLSQYRWMPDKLWLDSDVKVIYKDLVAYVISWQARPKIVVIRDKSISDAEKKVFEFVWEISAKPTHSTSKVRY